RGVGKGETQLPAEKRGHHVADALEGHVQELRARDFLEHADSEEGRASRSGGSEGKPPGIAFAQREQLGERPRGHRRVIAVHDRRDDAASINFTGRAGHVSCAWADAACSAKKTTTTAPNPRFMTFPPAAKVYSRFPPFAKSRLDEIGAERGILIAKEPRCVVVALHARCCCFSADGLRRQPRKRSTRAAWSRRSYPTLRAAAPT